MNLLGFICVLLVGFILVETESYLHVTLDKNSKELKSGSGNEVRHSMLEILRVKRQADDRKCQICKLDADAKKHCSIIDMCTPCKKFVHRATPGQLCKISERCYAAGGIRQCAACRFAKYSDILKGFVEQDNSILSDATIKRYYDKVCGIPPTNDSVSRHKCEVCDEFAYPTFCYITMCYPCQYFVKCVVPPTIDCANEKKCEEEKKMRLCPNCRVEKFSKLLEYMVGRFPKRLSKASVKQYYDKFCRLSPMNASDDHLKICTICKNSASHIHPLCTIDLCWTCHRYIRSVKGNKIERPSRISDLQIFYDIVSQRRYIFVCSRPVNERAKCRCKSCIIEGYMNYCQRVGVQRLPAAQGGAGYVHTIIWSIFYWAISALNNYELAYLCNNKIKKN